MRVEVLDDKISVYSEYCDQFIVKAKKIGGKWNSTKKSWDFSKDEELLLRKLLKDVYGEDGFEEVEKTFVRINLDEYEDKVESITDEIEFFGRKILRRPGRDYKVCIHPTVIIENGSFPSRGGSVAHPKINQTENMILYVKQVPIGLAEKAVKDYPTVFEIIKSEATDIKKIIKTEEALEILNMLATKNENISSAKIKDICKDIKDGKNKEEIIKKHIN